MRVADGAISALTEQDGRGSRLPISAYSDTFYATQKLGDYQIGCFVSSTIFERYSLGGRHPDLPYDDMDQAMTSHHETFHSAQDLATGFFAMVNEMMLQRDEIALENIRDILMSHPTAKLPLSGVSLKSAFDIADQYNRIDKDVQNMLQASNDPAGLSATDVIEGAAAFYTEIYRRLHVLFEMQLPPKGFEDIYNFRELCKRIECLPETYSRALAYYRKSLVSHWTDASDVDICNLFLTLCDLSLHVVEPSTVWGTADPRLTDFMPGDRLARLIRYVAGQGAFPRGFPAGVYSTVLVFSGSPFLGGIAPTTQKQKMTRAKNLEERFNAKAISLRQFEQYLDSLSSAMGWNVSKDVCKSWIGHFEKQVALAPRDAIQELRLHHMRERIKSPALLATFPNIRKALISRDYPTFCRTASGTKIWGGTNNREQIRNAICLKMFIRSAARMSVVTGCRACPFAGQSVYNCPDEINDCSAQISLENPLFNTCLFGMCFQHFVGRPVSDAFRLLDMSNNAPHLTSAKPNRSALEAHARTCSVCGRDSLAVIEGQPIVVQEISRFISRCPKCGVWLCSACSQVEASIRADVAEALIRSNPRVAEEIAKRYGSTTIQLMTVHCRFCGSRLGDSAQGFATVFKPIA